METRRIQFFSDEMKEQLAAGEARGAELKRRNEEILMALRGYGRIGDTERAALDEEKAKIEASFMALKTEIEKLQFAKELQKTLDEKVRPVQTIIQMVATGVPDEMVEFLRPIVGAVLETFEQMEPEQKRWAMFEAKSRFNKFQALKEVGFTAEQAMQILLVDVGKPTIFKDVATTANNRVAKR
ncbi:MAG: hypothetical protein UU48_C0006G0133 [Candidatus Uhrbacteria bacterium GW2011_GWF2_41_16]|uniref:Uncharacterized protein n=2 Tax=Candidatus Uhriibacteriota TaxID=1752732 RepID=A0A0G0VB14_9BACT|nr:MAG: hypothetical protein UU35_C0009G0002 [Candidatus Uhrbacteria bacterium GW2011_GWC2_41_11]KKR98093.1 MAG: hypothetical protein UU48_C0006G0133 [Candidatus Uhrbacteria bacterium GW2011_GWF2_41_16]